MSQRSSGPSTPKREEEFSPIDLFMTESQHYSGPAMPNVLSHQDLGEALMLDGCQTGLMATHSSKPFPEYDYGDTLSSYGNPAGSLNQEMQTTIAPSAAYQNLSFGYGSYHPYSDFSSPMGSAFTSPVAERPPPTIMPSQTIVSFSAADRALSFYDLKTESSDDSELMGSYNSFTTPSPSCSPTRYDSSSSRSIRTSRSSNSMQVLRTPETPTRDRTLGSTHRITKTCRTTYRKANIDGQPLIVFGEDAKPHACQEVPGCKRRFKRQEHLKRHEKTHRNDKPYVCPIPKCERAFNRQDNLKAHKTTHKKPGGRNVYVKDFVD
ncbi:MAG: hypothetical protein M1827_006084 [Pycnora praestabilis]|nr:MAG: hypothetical protein M1827_006084 [Pycnora praestabilis]